MSDLLKSRFAQTTDIETAFILQVETTKAIASSPSVGFIVEFR